MPHHRHLPQAGDRHRRGLFRGRRRRAARPQADEKVLLGPSPAARELPRVDGIVAACHGTGAEAVHPGYGFLSERAAFAEALAGGRDRVRRPAARCDPGHGRQDREQAAGARGRGVDRAGHARRGRGCGRGEVAREIGYPVMVKACAGGGGKGMRIAHDDRSWSTGGARASEALASFGDDRVFIEKTWSSRATSRSRCWATSTATWCTSASASARSSGATRR